MVYGLGLNTYSFIQQGPIEACLAEFEDDFNIFELVMYPGHLWPAERSPAARAKLRAQIEAQGARVPTVNMPNVDINIVAEAPEMRSHCRRLLTDIIRLAGDLGAEAVIVGPGKANPLFPEARTVLEDRLAAALDDLRPVAKAAGVGLWLENMPFAFLPRSADLKAFLDRYGADDLGVVYDAANALFAGEDFSLGLKNLAPRLHLTHVSDTGRFAYRHDPVGDGIVSFADFREALKDIGHRRPPVLEVIAASNPAGAVRRSAELLLSMGYGPETAFPE